MLFEQIASNKRKTYWVVSLFVLLTIGIGTAAGYYFFGDLLVGAIVTTLAIAIYLPITLLAGKKSILRMNHAQRLTSKEQAPHLWYVVENLSMVARIPMPEIYIIEDESPNAFATGFSPEKAAVAITTGMLNKLSREEIEAVMAHEIAHIKNYDIRLVTVSIALIAIIVFISDFATRHMLFARRDNKNPYLAIAAVVLVMLAPVLGHILHFALSRNREYLADATGAEFCRNPLALASALQKIASDDSETEQLSASSASLFFNNPFEKKKNRKLMNWFSTHPPTSERIKRLEEM